MKDLRTKVLSIAAMLMLTVGAAAAAPQSVTGVTDITAYAEVMKDGTEGKCGISIRWEINNGVLTLSGSGDMYDYKSTDDSPFAMRKDFQRIVISKGITSIGKKAFYGCSSVTSVSLPQGITQISDDAFNRCRKLTSIKIPGTVKTIGSCAFYMTYDLASISLPKGLTKIAEHAFAYSGITSAALPDTLTSIGNNAFSYSELKDLTIPSSVKTVANASFWNCTKLETLTVKSGVMRITSGAFNGCSKLSSVKLPDTLTVIGQGAFDNCHSLKSINIPKSVNTIGAYAFESTDLTSITIPDNVTSIGEYAFRWCASLKKAVLPKKLEDIPDGLFCDCAALESVTMPPKLKTIGKEAFYQCKALKLTELPGSVTSIGKRAFVLCQKLKNLTIPKGVRVLPQAVFSGCMGLESVKLQEGLKTIDTAAFEGCTYMKSVNIPTSVTKLGENAFASCASLTSITIPSGVTNIPTYAFYNCNKIKSIVIPKSVTQIGSAALGYSYNSKAGHDQILNGFMIKCFKGSAAEKYAKQNKVSYALITAVAAVKPSCETNGCTAHWICQGKYYSNALLTKATTKDKVTLKAPGHKWSQWKLTQKATVNKNEVKTRRCTVCNAPDKHTGKKAITYLKGDDRYETAVSISKASHTSSDTVILAYGLNYADALAGVPLAAKLDAPILLTAKDSLPAQTLAEIKRLRANNVLILGGTSAISSKVEKILKNNKLHTQRIAGKTRFGTAAAIAQRLNSKPTEVFFVYGMNYADALSIGSAAAISKAPIIYLNKSGNIDAETAKYLAALKKKGCVKNAYVIGGKSVITDSMKVKAAKALGLKQVKRVSGENRFLTCAAVNKKFDHLLSSKGLCVATGMDFPDALAGGVFAARSKAPLFLINSSQSKPYLFKEQKAYLYAKKASSLTIFGGNNAVPQEHIKDIAALCV